MTDQQRHHDTEQNDNLSQQPEHSIVASDHDQNTASPQTTKRKLIILFVVILLLSLIAFGLWKSYRPQQVSVQGRVEANTLHISTKVPSRIETIYVKEGQTVKKGQVLIKLSSPEIHAKMQQAQASLQSALALQSTAQRGSQQENIDTLYANWKSMQAQAQLAHQTFVRGNHLYQQGVISRQRRDEMYAAKISAGQLSEAAYQQYARAKRGSTTEQKSTADAQVEIARAAVAEAQALDAETLLSAPMDAKVAKIYAEPTELVASAVPILSLLQDDYWVSLNVREDQYASVYQHQSLQGFIPALNQNARFNLHNIEAEGDFATIKTTRQTGGYDIRSFKLHLTPAQPMPDLKVGMSVIFNLQQSP